MLTDEQNALLFRLSEYPVADKEACYIVMQCMPDEYRKASYALRPLMRYDYITRRKDGLYSITCKGRDTIEFYDNNVVSCGGDKESGKSGLLYFQSRGDIERV